MYFCSKKKVQFPSSRSAFFKIPSHQKFEYRTRFYDQEKELRKERLAQLKEKEGTIYASGVHTLRGKFRRTDSQRMQSQSSYRVIILAAMLFLTMFLLIYQINLYYVIPILIVLAVLLFKFSKRI